MASFLVPPRLVKNAHDHERRVTWIELFFDLVYVATFIQLGNVLSEDITFLGFWRFALLFTLLWWAWTDITFYINRFIVDDAAHRLLMYLQMVGVALIGVSVGGAFNDLLAQFVWSYILIRVGLILLYLRSWQVDPAVQPLIKVYVASYLLGIGLWIVSLFLPPAIAPWIWLLALGIEIVTVFLPRTHALHTQFPVHIHHMRERYGIFVIIVLGESFIKIITAGLVIAVNTEILIFSILGIFVVFGLWWLYFSRLEVTTFQPKRFATYLWIYAHLPLTLGFIAFGVAAKKVFASIGEPYIKTPYLLLYCIALLLGIIASLLIDTALQPSSKLRLYWPIFALAVLIILIAASPKLSALVFISIMAGLFAILVAAESGLLSRTKQPPS